DAAARRIVPVAWNGAGKDYIDMMPLGLDEAQPEAFGLAGRAVMHRKEMIAEDMVTDKRVQLGTRAQQLGFHSLVVLPLTVSGQVIGVVALYAAEIGFFDEAEMKLLLELSGDISFAIASIQNKD